jgi:hypothetical protein
MGTKADMKRRQNIRKDDGFFRKVIEVVRKFIFEKGYLVTGAAVGAKLKEKSWVPTRVMSKFTCPLVLTLILPL